MDSVLSFLTVIYFNLYFYRDLFVVLIVFDFVCLCECFHQKGHASNNKSKERKVRSCCVALTFDSVLKSVS